MKNPSKKSSFWIKATFVVAATVALFAWSITPLQFDYVDNNKKIVLFGTASHILPIDQIRHAIFCPCLFCRVLIPIELEQLRKKAIANVGGT